LPKRKYSDRQFPPSIPFPSNSVKQFLSIKRLPENQKTAGTGKNHTGFQQGRAAAGRIHETSLFPNAKPFSAEPPVGGRKENAYAFSYELLQIIYTVSCVQYSGIQIPYFMRRPPPRLIECD
jgi:hypothetical protein